MIAASGHSIATIAMTAPIVMTTAVTVLIGVIAAIGLIAMIAANTVISNVTSAMIVLRSRSVMTRRQPKATPMPMATDVHRAASVFNRRSMAAIVSRRLPASRSLLLTWRHQRSCRQQRPLSRQHWKRLSSPRFFVVRSAVRAAKRQKLPSSQRHLLPTRRNNIALQ